MIVADSDVLIDALAGLEPARGRIDLELETGQLATTSITAFELLSGARTDRDLARIESLLGALAILPLDPAASRAAAAVRRDLEARGEGIGLADYLIAGICLTHSAVLLSRKRQHFARVRGLTLGRLNAGRLST